MSSFIRPIGVHRDIKELEFISALLQSHQHVIRSSGSIKAVDIAVYLKSRHGIIVADEVIDQLIVTELAGQIQNDTQKPSDEDLKAIKSGKEKKAFQEGLRTPIDICQIVAILLIPELLEASESADLKVFAPFRDTLEASMKDGMITAESLRELFESVHECNVSDEVIDEMLELTNRSEGLIDALVSDIALYKEHDDVSNTPALVKAISAVKSEDTLDPLDASSNDVTARSLYTAPFIDFSSDTFRRPFLSMQLWTTGIAAYFAYALNAEGDWISTKCDSDSYSCEIANGLVAWLNVFFQIIALGLPYIILGSFSNANIAKLYRIPAILISMATVSLVTIFTYMNEIDTIAFTTIGNKDLSGAAYFCDQDDLECIENCQLQPDTCVVKYVAHDNFFGVAYVLAIVLGFSILLCQGIDMVLTLLPRCWLNGNGLIQRLVLPGTLRQERAGKQAASFRMKQVLQNALDIIYNKSIASSSNNSDGFSAKMSSSSGLVTKANQETSVLERFLLLPVKTETVGGVIWSWKRMWDGTIFTQEGIWLNSRLLTCNFAQVTIFGIMIFFSRVFFYKQKDFFYSNEERDYQARIKRSSELLYGNYTDVVGDDYYLFLNCSQSILGVDLLAEGGGLVDYTQPWSFIAYITAKYLTYGDAKAALKLCFDAYPVVSMFLDDSHDTLRYASDKLKDLVRDLKITPQHYDAAVIFGLLGGFLAVTYIAVLLIPSFITTAMKYRSGVTPTLTDPEFLRKRCAMDTVTVLLGSAFWGCFFTATGAMLFMVLLVLFIGILPLIFGAVAGFAFILAIRMAVLIVLRISFFSALYRNKPGAANIMFTVLEVWNVALTLGFVFIRTITLILISTLYVARIDTPFLAPGVGRFGGVDMDTISIAFEKDLLIHEAHRHMFIERFGLLCLLKLHAGSKFGTRAGSAWRLLFVLITMPWLRKYRVDRITIALEEEIEQMQDDMEGESDVSRLSEQKLKMKELQSEKALMNVEKDLANEASELRKRNEYLEGEVKILQQRLIDFSTQNESNDERPVSTFEVPV